MKYVASAGIGLLLAIIVTAIPSVLAFIPGVGAVIAICSCLLWPGLSAVAGYGAASLVGVGKDDWGGLGMEMGILSLTFAVVSVVISLLLTVLGMGASVARGSDAGVAALVVGMGIVGSVCGFIMNFGITFVAAFIGGAICIATKK